MVCFATSVRRCSLLSFLVNASRAVVRTGFVGRQRHMPWFLVHHRTRLRLEIRRPRRGGGCRLGFCHGVRNVRKRKKHRANPLAGIFSLRQLKRLCQFRTFEPQSEFLDPNQLESTWFLILKQRGDANENGFVKEVCKPDHIKTFSIRTPPFDRPRKLYRRPFSE
jgi:hypothetical protein